VENSSRKGGGLKYIPRKGRLGNHLPEEVGIAPSATSAGREVENEGWWDASGDDP